MAPVDQAASAGLKGLDGLGRKRHRRAALESENGLIRSDNQASPLLARLGRINP